MLQRRVMAAASVAVLAFSLAACGSDDGDSSSTSKGLEGTGEFSLVLGKDTSGNLKRQVDAWNKAHPDQKGRLIELPEAADAQRQQLVQNAQTKSDAYTVIGLDVVWTAEFAANGWIEELPKDEFELDKFLPAAVKTGEYFGKQYAIPSNTNGGLLFYRKDLLDKAGVTAAPKTWDELYAACDKVKALPEGKSLSCYAGQFDKYEGLTVNFSEAVNSAGGRVFDDEGKPTVNSAEAKEGLNFLVDGFKTGRIDKKAITYQEEPSRRAFQEGQVIFLRNWPYVAQQAAATDGSSKIAGKFAYAPIPGLKGTGSTTLGGYDYAISKFAKNKKTALEFIKFVTTEEEQKKGVEATSNAPVLSSLYADADLGKKFPYLPVLKESLDKGVPRPSAVKYQAVSTAIQEAVYAAIAGTKPADKALEDLQKELEELTKK